MAAAWSGVSSKGKPAAKRCVVVPPLVELHPFPRFAPGVDLEQLRRDVVGFFPGLALGFFPLFRTQAVQRRVLRIAAGVAADQLQRGDGHVEF
jgi:hypothetical protein